MAQSNQWSELPGGSTNPHLQGPIPSTLCSVLRSRPRAPPAVSSCSRIWLFYNGRLSPAIESHYDVQPVLDVYASPDRRDLGRFAADVSRGHRAGPSNASARNYDRSARPGRHHADLVHAPGVGHDLRGGVGVFGDGCEFQSWADPFIILMALPGAMAGMLWMLYLTGTTLNVPSLMGAIMCIGVATSNSILLVTFANDVRVEGHNASAGRPVRRVHAYPASDHDSARHDHWHDSHGSGDG